MELEHTFLHRGGGRFPGGGKGVRYITDLPSQKKTLLIKMQPIKHKRGIPLVILPNKLGPFKECGAIFNTALIGIK